MCVIEWDGECGEWFCVFCGCGYESDHADTEVDEAL